jgi:fructoselysine 6-phosphate deglycase
MTEHQKQIEAAVKASSKIKIREVYFVACGGSKAIMEAPKYILDKETVIASTVFNSNEFLHRTPKALGTTSIVILCSHSGTTPETVAAALFAKNLGAITIGLSHVVDSPLWNSVEHPIHYDHGSNAVASETNNVILYRLIFSLLNSLQPSDKYDRALSSLQKMQDVFNANREKYTKSATDYGEKNKREKLVYTMASGPNYGVAYSFSICLLMEMLWINSAAIHSGEYFHGPFEITDYDVPFLLVKGVGSTRPLDERSAEFIPRFSKKLEIVDGNDFEWGTIDNDLKEYFCPIIASVILRMYAEALGFSTGHPLTVRRYMWRLQY